MKTIATLLAIALALGLRAPAEGAQAAKPLLTVDDVPAGWSLSRSSDSSAEKKCGKNLGSTRADAIDASDAKQYSGVTVSAQTFAPGKATALLASIRKLLAATCPPDTVRDGSTTYTLKLSLMKAPVIGDEAVAYRRTIEGGVFTTVQDFIRFRKGDRLIAVGVIYIVPGDPPMDLASLTRKVAARVT